VLTVGVGPTFAMRWLIPRLGALPGAASRNPDPHHDRRGHGRVAKRLDLQHCARARPFRRRHLGAVVLAVVFAGVQSRSGQKAAGAEGSLSGDAARCPPCARRLAAVDEARRTRRGEGRETGRLRVLRVAIQAALDGIGVAIGLNPYIVAIWRRDGWLRRSNCRCARSRGGI